MISTSNELNRSSSFKHSFSSISLPLSDRDFLEDEISTILINSDPSECNENFSIYIKCVLDNVYTEQSPSYQLISTYSLRLLTSNMFIKNYKFCIGKILAFLETFTGITNSILYSDSEYDEKVIYENECMKEFILITLLLLLKLKNTQHDQHDKSIDMIDLDELYYSLSKFKIVSIISQFITTQIIAIEHQKSSFVILKFGCDVVFEYLYHAELLSDSEFESLIENSLISTLIKYLLSNDDFDNYDFNNEDDDEFTNEHKLIAYEELKLLLLLNEQFLMKFYNLGGNCSNLVFDELIKNSINSNHIVKFINLLIYHLNREESQIIKILILKFLYLVFTTSFTTKLIYLNDLKILIDILIRELNDLDYQIANNKILLLTYLRVLHPILIFSQIESENYKVKDIRELLSNIVLNFEENEEEDRSIQKLAVKCLNIKWLKDNDNKKSESPSSTNSSDSDLTELKISKHASIKAGLRSDYHKHTTVHNFMERRNSEKKTMILENNANVFLSNELSDMNLESIEDEICKDSNILDLPTEYLNSKPLPKLPVSIKKQNVLYQSNNSSSTSINSNNSLKQKALRKPAPPIPVNRNSINPPPPPPPRRRKFL